MIQWIHAGVGVFTLLVLCIFLIVYIGVFSTVTTRKCGAPLPGPDGDQGAQGAQGKAIAPGPTGKQSTVPGPQGFEGPDALGIMTGGTPLPAGTGFWTGNTGNSGFPGEPADILFPIGAPPVNFRFLNNGIGSDLSKYEDTGYFSVIVTSNAAAAPGFLPVDVRFVRIGDTVVFQVKQIVFNHGGASNDWINFIPAQFAALQQRFFFNVTSFATTAYKFAQTVIVFDRIPFNNGLFRLEIAPNNQIDSMRILFRSDYSPQVDDGSANLGSLNDRMTSKFLAGGGAGTFGTASEFAVTWTLV